VQIYGITLVATQKRLASRCTVEQDLIIVLTEGTEELRSLSAAGVVDNIVSTDYIDVTRADARTCYFTQVCERASAGHRQVRQIGEMR